MASVSEGLKVEPLDHDPQRSHVERLHVSTRKTIYCNILDPLLILAGKNTRYQY
jgi:hypothetical protein